MSRPPSLVDRFWQSDWSLTVLLGVLVFEVFVLGPLDQLDEAPGMLGAIFFSLFLLSGVTVALRNRLASAFAFALGITACVVRWQTHVNGGMVLARADTAVALAFCLILIAVIMVQVLRPGRVNVHRIRGAVAVYLLLGLTFGFAYTLVALSDPNAFSVPAEAVPLRHLRARLLYFSTTTLTTIGFGDVAPVNPVARSLAALEGIVGQLFPVILVARLVSQWTPPPEGQPN